MTRYFKTDVQAQKVVRLLKDHGYQFVNYASDEEGDELSFVGTHNTYVNLRFNMKDGFYVQTNEVKAFDTNIDKLLSEAKDAKFLYDWIMEVIYTK